MRRPSYSHRRPSLIAFERTESAGRIERTESVGRIESTEGKPASAPVGEHVSSYQWAPEIARVPELIAAVAKVISELPQEGRPCTPLPDLVDVPVRGQEDGPDPTTCAPLAQEAAEDDHTIYLSYPK
jgi:hypothetical protein